MSFDLVTLMTIDAIDGAQLLSGNFIHSMPNAHPLIFFYFRKKKGLAESCETSVYCQNDEWKRVFVNEGNRGAHRLKKLFSSFSLNSNIDVVLI